MTAAALFVCCLSFTPAPAARGLGSRGVRLAADETKGAVGGAILGGLLRFGAIWGAQIGGSMGASARQRAALQQQLDAMGVTPEVIATARDLARQVVEAEDSLEIVRRAVDSQASLADVLTEQAAAAYRSAEAALRRGDEAGARAKLEEKRDLALKRSAAEREVAAAREREAAMVTSLDALATRARSVEESIRAATERGPRGASSAAFELEVDDPLLERFKKL